jgi:gamma-butyrobetaine dioxygenase
VNVADEIIALFAGRGAGAYFGEPVSMAEHALQAAYFAEAAGAPPPLVVAALLHDIGHLVVPVPDDLALWTHDARHEEVGAGWLARRFPAQVVEAVRLHVSAKRYLCAVDAGYFSRLSEASVVTLKLQGGAMSEAETAAFEAEPHWRDAVQVRRCDDLGKVAGLATPGFAHYREWLEELAAARDRR